MQRLLDELVALRGYKPKILVVDDQPLNIRLVHELFKDDCDVIMATSGEQALLKCEAQNPDLVLLDVMMPEMSGHEVCRKLKANGRTANIPVIFLTAQDDEDDQTFGFELGAVDFISKPISGPMIRARVRSHLALKLQSELFQSIALTDGLTGIANRRRFDESFQRDWAQCARTGQRVSLLMIDVDHFKRYNDHYGHQQGDECLQRVAKGIKSLFKRPYDLVARYGGEEFVCLLPNTDLQGAAALAQQVLQAIRDLNIEHADSETAQSVTVSIGVATKTATNAFTSSGLIGAADEQLYYSKRQGRDRWTAVDLDTPEQVSSSMKS
jgi:diguanylate cyclase (GGDEF)-like protein